MLVAAPTAARQPRQELTEKQYAAIGRVAALWSEVEHGIEKIAARLALAPSLLGYVLTDKLGPDNRISAILSLLAVHKVKYDYELADEAVLKEIASVIPRLRQMKDDRNFIVHSIWIKSGRAHMTPMAPALSARSGKDVSVGEAEKSTLKSSEMKSKRLQLI